ncbi:MAG: hypothetical protein ABI330_17740 [Caldimonas sp.]
MKMGPVSYWLYIVLCVATLVAMCGRRGIGWTFAGLLATACLCVIALGFSDRLGMRPDPAGRRAGFAFLCALFLATWGSRTYRFRGSDEGDHTRAQILVRIATQAAAWALSAAAVFVLVHSSKP